MASRNLAIRTATGLRICHPRERHDGHAEVLAPAAVQIRHLRQVPGRAESGSRMRRVSANSTSVVAALAVASLSFSGV